MSFEHPFFLPLRDGCRLPCRHLAAAGNPRAIVHICHGLAEHSARYQGFAKTLSEAGYHIYAHDHRGHGLNIGRHAPRGQIAHKDGQRIAIDDIVELNRHVRLSHPDLPVILFGHSMGGLIALNYALDHADTIAALAVWNASFGRMAEHMLAMSLLYAERMLKGSDVPSRILPKLTFRAWGEAIAGHRTPFDWLSHDQKVVDAYMADPLCGFDASVSLWMDIVRWMKRGSNDRNFMKMPRNLPISLVGGSEDPATEGGRAVSRLHARLRRMGFSRVQCQILPGARHECLNERNHADITQNFLRWLHENL
ncbi:alpha/beta fold hydrolase [Daeguia caeni]|uniref:Alpha/beta fold hydrolase n=1 Tax=Daeguia caeni TaxID=439612 RepID=A0ABV9H3Q2_9HYPH